MAPPTFRPENAIKRAEELISVGNSQAALQSLYDFVTAKRVRWTQPATLEPIVFKFLELGVELKKGKMIRDCLHQYKKLIQGTPEGLISVGVVARKFIDIVEKRIVNEQAKEEERHVDLDDLEGGITPENLLISIYEEDQSVGGFNDETFTSWVRFTWESYRSVLELVRNNSQLEITYSGVVSRTMQFCLKHNRKNEFKRLADMLRQHLDAANYQQNKNGTNIVDLSDNDTLQRYLDQRFQLVQCSVKLELWHEAFRAVEDVYHLIKMSKRAPKMSTLAAYYKNIAKIFYVSSDSLLHTTAWNKFYELYSSNPNATEEEFKEYASIILLSALAIKLDILPSVGFDSQLRLYRLVGLENKPSRKEIFDNILNSDIASKVDKNVMELYTLIEKDFSIENIQSKLATLLPKLVTLPYFAQYSTQIRDVILRKLFVEISTKYETITIDELFKLATLPEPMNLGAWEVEKTLLQAAMDDYVSFTIDQAKNTVKFVKDPFEQFLVASATASTEEPEQDETKEDEVESVEGDEKEPKTVENEEGETIVEPEVIVTRNSYIRNKLFQLSATLHENENYSEISYLERVRLARESLITQTKASIERAKEAAEERAKRSQEQRQRRLQESEARFEQDAELRQRRMLEEKAAMEVKLAEEAHRRLIEKKKRELAALKEAEALKAIEEINANGNVYIDPAEAKNLDLKELRSILVNQLSKDKAELEERVNYSVKKLDHTERALRKTELPILQREADTLKEADMVKYKAMTEKIVEAAKSEHEARLADYERVSHVCDEVKQLREKLFQARAEEYQAIQGAKREAFEKAKQERIDKVRKERYEAAVAKRKQEIAEASRLKRLQEQEAIARRQREVEEALEQKAAASKAASRIPAAAPVVAKNRADLDAIARRQREIEEAVERRAAAASNNKSSGGSKYVPPSARAAPVAKKTASELDEIARKQREMEEAIERKLSAKSASPSPAAVGSTNGSSQNSDKPLSFAEKMKLRRQQQQNK
ncbi:translation initiation factor eIF3 core subunit a PWA37_005298 [Arxiozyma heterogenica]|uniref:Eukaryotic translation initiation factor 3 subunit A n=1 Tax=Arxiozyma heterogenica TaxID=278026 RepID=A0AAN7WQ92_9SACH|nr:hypothetical protein RI543_000230 [Kazachstania heterogenica]